MANQSIYKLQVLTRNSVDLQQISDSLREASTELVNSVAGRFTSNYKSTPKPTDTMRENIQGLVAFEEIDRFDAEGIREFGNTSKRGNGLILDHVAEISRQFPKAVFLLEHCDDQMNYFGKMVINSGAVAAEVDDSYQRAQATPWVLPDIFTPFRIEHEHNLKFGSLWQEWLDDTAAAVQVLECRTKGDFAQAKQLTDGLLSRNTSFHYRLSVPAQCSELRPNTPSANFGIQHGTSK